MYKSRLLKAGTVAGDCAVSAALPVAVDQIERDLHGVESRSLLDLVRHNPERKPVVIGKILAEPAHEHGVCAGSIEGIG